MIKIMSVIVLMSCINVQAQIHLIETFNGDGPFFNTEGTVAGLDNPDWLISGAPGFQDGGLVIDVDTARQQPDTTAGFLSRSFADVTGDFHETFRISDFSFRISEFVGVWLIRLDHFLDSENPAKSAVGITLNVDDFGVNVGVLAGTSREFFEGQLLGPEIEFSIDFDAAQSHVLFSYEDDPTDEVPPRTFGPYDYEGPVADNQSTRIAFGVQAAGVLAIVDHWSLLYPNAPIRGDFNRSGSLDVEDIDLLTAAIRSDENNPDFDLVEDQRIDEFDLNFWVHSLRRTFFGDSNLDGEFNSTDLIAIFQANEYEDDIELNSTWSTGDWNGDQEFDSRDLVFAFGDGGYEIGPRDAAQSVPEPLATAWLAAILSLFAFRRQLIIRYA